jgi:1-acyl-sn-glycerol-3-phosphate acyltransferase
MRVFGYGHLRKIPHDRGVIFVTNHRSELDPIIVTAAIHPLSRFTPLYYSARPKGDYQYYPLGKYIYGGWFFRIWGAYPVYKAKGDYGVALRHHIDFLKAGKSVCFFPEGGWNDDGTKRPARPGVVYLASLSGAILVPTLVEGVEDKKVTVTFGKPFELRDLSSSHGTLGATSQTIAIAEEMMQRVYALSHS